MSLRGAKALSGVRRWGIIAGACLWGLAACRPGTPAPPANGPDANVPAATPAAATITAAPLPATPAPPPTATPEPLAASVNGDGIQLAAYQKEVRRCQAGKASAGADPGTCPASALQSLIEQRVVEQAAIAAGLTVSDGEVQAAESQIKQSLGADKAYGDWLSANFYTDGEFRQALRLDRLRAKMAEQVMATVPLQAEQVHALDLVVADEATAQKLLQQLDAGADFSTLALTYSMDLSSRAAGGDLGWFPHGVLTAPEVEAAAFALQPNQTSGVIHSALGYHLVRVIERDPARPLSPAALQILRTRAYQAWLDAQMSRAVVQRFVSP
jgi:parvulin-like peptidyl-prolyl isomerase